MNTRPITSPESRFWKHVMMLPCEPGCWLWTGATSDRGYGNIGTGPQGEAMLAHRLSYMMHKGPIPDGLVVRHSCDTRCCVNPAHLLIGTQADNLQDMVDRGRARRGTTPGRPKIQIADVVEIRRRLAAGERQRDLLPVFGISRGQMSKIALRQCWKNAA